MTATQDGEELTGVIVPFLREIGLIVQFDTLREDTFVPGIYLRHGGLVVDTSRLAYPGDLLHEAGHLAVMPPERRAEVDGDAGKSAAEEMMAIAWSYAALVHLGLDPAVVFHGGGYKGDSESLIENFTNGRTFGVPLLQWLGMTYEPAQAAANGADAYPRMIRWLRPAGAGETGGNLEDRAPQE